VAAKEFYVVSKFVATASSAHSITVNATVNSKPGVIRRREDSWSFTKISLVFNDNGGTQYRTSFSPSFKVFSITLFRVLTTRFSTYCHF